MRINVSKTKVMSALILDEQRQAVLLGNQLLEEVDKLGSTFIANGQGTDEARSRINFAPSAFYSLQSCLWLRRDVPLRTKSRVSKAVGVYAQSLNAQK